MNPESITGGLILEAFGVVILAFLATVFLATVAFGLGLAVIWRFCKPRSPKP